jgi:7-cyano-7-deazaguanine reductase
MVAHRLCVQTKNLKQYFWSFRDEDAFHEKAAIAPRFMRIHPDGYGRGGIRTFVTVEQRKIGWKLAEAVVPQGGPETAL